MKPLFTNLKIVRQNRYQNEGFTEKENIGIDTETYNGYARLICDSDNRMIFEPDFDACLKFLTNSSYRNKFCWFYNLRFDIDAIMKHFIDKEALNELYSGNQIEYKDFIFELIPKKYFGISKDHNYYDFFDIAQYYKMSLDSAAKKYLNKQKDGVDSSKLNTDLDYWSKNRIEIIEYCKQDARLTKALADHFITIMKDNLKMNFKCPFSTASLSEQYFKEQCYIPTINPFIDERLPKDKRNLFLNILQYAHSCYYGGRFELLKKGYFDKVYEYDIKSAYPSQMKDLIDFSPSHGKWIHTNVINEESYEGFYYCNVSNSTPFFSPFVYKDIKTDSNIYPNYEKGFLYLTKSDLTFINDYPEEFGYPDVKVIDGYEFFPDIMNFPFKREIEKLYKWKESENDEAIRMVVKTVLNSIYGKTIQNINNITGSLWNPIYASLITARTRIELLESVIDKPENVISFATDAVLTKEPLSVPKKPKLGDFGEEFNGECIILENGVYDLWNDKISISKRRGFGKPKEGYEPLKNILNSSKGLTINLETKSRPLTMKESLFRGKPEEAGNWIEQEKNLNLKDDIRRSWYTTFKSGKDVLKRSINSLPLTIPKVRVK